MMNGGNPEAEPVMPDSAPEKETPGELESYAQDFEKLASEVEGHLDDPTKQTAVINMMVGLEKNSAFRTLRSVWNKLPAGAQNWFAGTGTFGNVLRQAGEASRLQSEPIRFLVEAGLLELKDPQQGPDTLNDQDVEDLNKIGWAAKIVSFAAPEVEVIEKLVKPAMKLVGKKTELTNMIHEAIESERARESAETIPGQIGVKEVDFAVGETHKDVENDLGLEA